MRFALLILGTFLTGIPAASGAEPGTPAEPGAPAQPGTPAESGTSAEPGTPAEPGTATQANLGAPRAARPAGARFFARHEITLFSDSQGPGFRSPLGVTTDPFGNVFVADTGNHRVVQFDEQGRKVFVYGGYGWREGEFSGPSDVSAAEGFRLFVVDEGNDRIQEFDIGDTSPEGVVFPFAAGMGLGGEELVRPSRIQLDTEGRIYVTDGLCHCVWIFTPTGELFGRLGELGDAPTRFRNPGGVAVGPKGRVYVADTGNRRIQVFDSIGNFLAVWGGPEDDFLVEPIGVEVGPEGNVWVADAGSAEVRVFTPAGVPLFRFGGHGDGPGSFGAPVDLAHGRNGRLWVVDEEREVVEGFSIQRLGEGE